VNNKGAFMITLIHAPRSRSFNFIWLLEEAEEPYELRYVDIRRGDGSGRADPANPHPHGKVPLLIDGETTVFEQSAIALYVADRFPNAGLGPAVAEPGRGSFLTMLAYYSGVVEPAFMSKFMGQTVPRGTAGWVDSDEVMDFLNASFANHPYVAGEAFTAADVMYAGAFALFMESPMLTGKRTKQLDDYVARCVGRPAHQRAAAKDAPPR
jgi:glutathione S-transferase